MCMGSGGWWMEIGGCVVVCMLCVLTGICIL